MSERAFNPLEVIPKVPGHYWVVPATVGFPVRVFLHRYPKGANNLDIELCASGARVSALMALLAGWEWYDEKPDLTPPDPEFVAAVARGFRMSGSRSRWNAAAAALRDVVRRAEAMECRCPELPKRGTSAWKLLQDGGAGWRERRLCLACSARDAIAKALEAERDGGPLVDRSG